MKRSSELKAKVGRGRPWQLNKDHQRKEKIDKLASDIIVEEALKLITESYESVFEGKEKCITVEGKSNNNSVDGMNKS